jgi:hypothetical protein
MIMLLNMSNAILVKGKNLAIATVVQGLEGRQNVRIHGVDHVPPKEMVVKGAPCSVAILLGHECLHMFSHTGSGKTRMEDGPNLL